MAVMVIIWATIIDLSGDEPIVVREGKGSLDIL
jgi:tRNA A37 threonylcarbamoyladenosine synthetase subunit TsaC/SUA5/YrdC